MAAALGGDETGAIVGDIGACSSKFGFAGDDTPKAVFSSALGCVFSGAAAALRAEGAEYVGTDFSLPPSYPSQTAVGEWPAVSAGPRPAAFQRTWIQGDVSTVGARHAAKGGDFDVRKPFNDTGDADWDVVEQLYCNAEAGLRCRFQDHPLMIGEPTRASASHREKACELLFEGFNVPALAVGRAAALAAFAAGRATALVAECSHGSTTVAPVVDGYVLRRATRSSNVGGRALDQRIASLLKCAGVVVRSRAAVRAERGGCGYTEQQLEAHSSFSSFTLLQVVQELKEASCLVRASTLPAAVKPRKAGKFELPDGTVIELAPEVELVPEALFEANPAETDVNVFLAASAPLGDGGAAPPPQDDDATGLPESLPAMVRAALERCDVDVRKDLLQNILLTGGGSLFPGMAERLHCDVSQRLSSPFKTKVVAASAVERKFSVWIGGSILASLGSFQQTWLSKAEYQEQGAILAQGRWD
ncbi:actin family [Pelagophyceae sp. CCMP2097]|nr:actin family [Pelagophyceae sp. CCMP2097]